MHQLGGSAKRIDSTTLPHGSAGTHTALHRGPRRCRGRRIRSPPDPRSSGGRRRGRPPHLAGRSGQAGTGLYPVGVRPQRRTFGPARTGSVDAPPRLPAEAEYGQPTPAIVRGLGPVSIHLGHRRVGGSGRSGPDRARRPGRRGPFRRRPTGGRTTGHRVRDALARGSGPAQQAKKYPASRRRTVRAIPHHVQ